MQTFRTPERRSDCRLRAWRTQKPKPPVGLGERARFGQGIMGEPFCVPLPALALDARCQNHDSPADESTS
jgi:hypothetical protein